MVIIHPLDSVLCHPPIPISTHAFFFLILWSLKIHVLLQPTPSEKKCKRQSVAYARRTPLSVLNNFNPTTPYTPYLPPTRVTRASVKRGEDGRRRQEVLSEYLRCTTAQHNTTQIQHNSSNGKPTHSTHNRGHTISCLYVWLLVVGYWVLLWLLVVIGCWLLLGVDCCLCCLFVFLERK